ncbi:unnamed protein product [Rhizoctonia solani]|uniref:Uncharacterized protein n=1 Tax=Rhizoctonia solani TaxID=456999 RepID=A0A8H3CB98_9AGAM|nr:unnamed protein product [Rhizoctonia solani]
MASSTQGKVVIVTGASSGIGKATSITLSKAGYRVVLVARREAELKATAKECSSETLITPGDVTDEAFAAKVFEETVKKFGAYNYIRNVRSHPDARQKEEWMSYSTIINNGSIAAYAPRPMAIAYTTSKHATTGLTKSTSLDGRNFNIACTQIDIGNAQTQMVADHGPTGQLQPNGQHMIEGSIDVQHVANAILHIANLPLDVTVLFMNIMATTMPFVGRG